MRSVLLAAHGLAWCVLLCWQPARKALEFWFSR